MVVLQDAVYRVLPHGSQELPSVPSLDDSVQVIETNIRDGVIAPTIAQHPHPTQLVTMSTDFLTSRNRSRILDFFIFYHDQSKTLKVKFSLYFLPPIELNMIRKIFVSRYQRIRQWEH